MFKNNNRQEAALVARINLVFQVFLLFRCLLKLNKNKKLLILQSFKLIRNYSNPRVKVNRKLINLIRRKNSSKLKKKRKSKRIIKSAME